MNLKEIVYRSEQKAITQEECLFVIKEYVKIRKGVEITPYITPPRGFNAFKTVDELKLMTNMVNHACGWLEDSILMQYTGLKDKNGVEIYEGDILKQENSIGKHSYDIVIYDNHIHELSHGGSVFGFHIENCWDINRIEVIGNVYENPELIK